jgi:hypothetical protein
LLLFVFAGEVVSGEPHPQAEEIAELRWFERQDLDHEPVFALVPLLLAKLGDTSHRHAPGLHPQLVAWPDGALRSVFMIP